MPRHLTPHIIRFWSLVATATRQECWPWQGQRNNHGYGRFQVRTDRPESGRPRRIAYERTYAHRQAYELVFGPIPEGLRVLHRCDNPPCCNPAHLFLGTQRDNVMDMWRKGRHPWTATRPNRWPTGG